MSVHGPYTRPDRSRYYRVRWREAGRERSKRVDRKADADLLDAEKRRRRQIGHLASTVTDHTLDEWVAERWAPEHAAGLEKSTRRLYARLYARHLEPYLGDVRLEQLTVGSLRRWQTSRLNAGASPDAVIKARTVLSSILRHAAEAEAIPGNPLALVPAPKRDHAEEIEPLAPRLVEQIAAHLDGSDRVLVHLLAYSGVRPGELRALRWSDIRERTILVQRAADPDGDIKPTKNRRARTVRLLPALALQLASYRTLTRPRARDLVIPGPKGAAMTSTQWNTWRARTWTPAVIAVLGHRARPYDLRHSFASLLLAQRVTHREVADELGHSVLMTQRVYGHVIAEYAGRTDPVDANIEVFRAIGTARTWLLGGRDLSEPAAPDPEMARVIADLKRASMEVQKAARQAR